MINVIERTEISTTDFFSYINKQNSFKICRNQSFQKWKIALKNVPIVHQIMRF
jgi:hypothetical protein